MTNRADLEALADVEIQAVLNGVVVGRYIGPPKRAASWARRANPGAELRAIALRAHAATKGETDDR